MTGRRLDRGCLARISETGDRWIDASRAQCNAWLARRPATLVSDDPAVLNAAAPVLERLDNP